jgi:hypothetical protein
MHLADPISTTRSGWTVRAPTTTKPSSKPTTPRTCRIPTVCTDLALSKRAFVATGHNPVRRRQNVTASTTGPEDHS